MSLRLTKLTLTKMPYETIIKDGIKYDVYMIQNGADDFDVIYEPHD